MTDRIVELVEGRLPYVVELADPFRSRGPVDPVDPGPPDVPPGTQPGDLFVAWSSASTQLIEGESVELVARLSDAVNDLRAIVVAVTVSTTADPNEFTTTPGELVFPPGETEATLLVETTGAAAAGATRVIELQLDSQAALVDNPTATPLATAATFGPDKVQVLVTDAAAGTPEFNIAGGDQTFPEGSGVRAMFVTLSVPAVDEVKIRVQTADGTALAGTHYTALNQVLTIPAGQSRAAFGIEILEDNEPAAMDPEFALTATLANGGTAVAGANAAVTITVADNDGGVGGTPFIEFVTRDQTLREGRSLIVQARVASALGSPLSFIGRTLVEVTRNLGGAVLGQDFSEDWGLNQDPRFLVFEPGASVATFVLNALEDGEADGAAGEFVEYEIIDPGDGSYQVNNATKSVRVTITDEEVTDTELLVPSHAGAATTRRVIQGMCAIVPPSTSLPEMALDSTGERVQLHGRKRNGAGEWISGFVYALSDGAESIPGEAGAIKLRLAEGTDQDPAEAGDFVAYPELRFSYEPAEAGEVYECQTGPAPISGNATTDWISATGPNGGANRTGPQLYEEKVVRMRPHRASVSPSLFMTSGDACGTIEICMKRIAGDDEVIMCSGRLHNGTHNPQADPFAPDPVVDGELNFNDLQVQVLDAGWIIDLCELHPSQSQAGGDTASLLVSRAESYFMPECGQHQFYFAIRKPTANAQARAKDYWRLRHIFWPVGTLGSTRQPIYGEACEPTVDWARAQLIDGTLSGWSAIKNLGEEQALGATGFQGLLSCWNTGARMPITEVTTGYDGTRRGWWFPSGPAGSGGPGGSGIDGQGAVIPWWGYWLRTRFSLMATFARSNLCIRDYISGSALYWWNVARTVNGQLRVAVQGGLVDRRGGWRHWKFNTARNSGSFDFYDLADPSPYQLGPITRPWNNPSVPDPATTLIRSTYPLEKPTHFARLRQGLIDGWECMGEWLSYVCWEEVAAFYSRAMPPVLPERDTSKPGVEDKRRFNPGFTVPLLQANPTFAGLGILPVDSTNYVDIGGAMRSYGWLLQIFGGFYGVAPTNVREALKGRGVVQGLGGQSQMDAIWDMLSLTAMDNGVLFRTTTQFADPNPYDPAVFQPPNLSLRTGGLPDPSSSDPTISANGAAFCLWFHMAFVVKGVATWRRVVWPELFSPQRTRLDKSIRFHDNYRIGSRVFGTGGGAIAQTNYPIVAQGPVVMGSLNSASALRANTFTAAEVRNGDARWKVLKIGQTEEDISGQSNKVGVTALAAARELDDQGLLDIAQEVYGKLDMTLQEFITYVIKDRNEGVKLELEMTTSTGGRRWSPSGEFTFMLGYVAHALNTFS